MITEYWPLFGLRLRTPRLELRVPGPDDLQRLAAVAAAGVHAPDRQPFVVPWTDVTPLERARNTLQWHWNTWARWSPREWSLNFVTVADGQVIGTQALDAKDFAVLRQVGTGSWLGREHQGKGYGTEMRAAVLDLAFTGLGAGWATSEAFADNDASYGVSRRLGYVDDGTARHLVRGEAVVGRRLRLDREGWAAARTVDVRIEGLEPCLPMFGL
ncbi:GNAT family protein [Actinoplanes sp. NPDC026623]|uniref:GNAT family N-acetyltransferase n=1 Tax=Actinoplanes sp. NPDC026623 TaxID=3155610 RepID=UPI00340A69C7